MNDMVQRMPAEDVPSKKPPSLAGLALEFAKIGVAPSRGRRRLPFPEPVQHKCGGVGTLDGTCFMGGGSAGSSTSVGWPLRAALAGLRLALGCGDHSMGRSLSIPNRHRPALPRDVLSNAARRGIPGAPDRGWKTGCVPVFYLRSHKKVPACRTCAGPRCGGAAQKGSRRSRQAHAFFSRCP
jgi:hypothetical protein